ncbi:MAG: ferredoxin family protein [Acidobacteria bacterium]|nr:ferredoxin family protein [Acidobacteriota bacterium]MBI1982735.1 ferredoxin family protein [Acidobacteriota bacterium]
MTESEIVRDGFPWFPTIDYDVCISDLDCVNFCPHEVFEWDKDTGRPLVARPDNCVPGCDSCAQLCHEKAISFPSKEEFRQAMRRLRAEARNASPSPGIS